ncbi:hypothetical protein [Aquiflexum sp.]|uniref:hypothetical protein n=1 Tax=Aquiflexum sp. TaxID=1872584 RepID=UPI00359374F1
MEDILQNLFIHNSEVARFSRTKTYRAGVSELEKNHFKNKYDYGTLKMVLAHLAEE